MSYKLSELKKQVPGVAGDRESKPVPALNSSIQRELNLRLDVIEGFTTEAGTPRSERASAQLAIDSLNVSKRVQGLGEVGLAGEISIVD